MRSWTERDLAVNWHPYTQMRECAERPPLVIERAEGLRLYDTAGRAYLDTISSWWCNVHGHNHPRIRAGIEEQLGRLDHVLFAGVTHPPAVALAEALVDLTPAELTRVFYTDNGSTAVEAALKMSLQFWRNSGRPDKQRFVCLDEAYHGDTIGAMSVAGPSVFNEPFAPLLFASQRVPTPRCASCPVQAEPSTCTAGCLQPLADLLAREHDRIAALILEPLLLGAGGMIVYPPQALARAAALAREHDVHLILDEVATGFGRTGTMFACEQAEVTPDFLCLSKGLTAGTLPLAATLTTERVYTAFLGPYEAFKTFYHGHTFTANPLGCAAALASLAIFRDEGVLQRIQPVIRRLQAAAPRFEALASVRNVRGIGMVLAWDLVPPAGDASSARAVRDLGLAFYRRGLEAGLLLRPLGPVGYLFLPLATTEADLDLILDRSTEVLAGL